MDDLYVFNADGTFKKCSGNETWLKAGRCSKAVALRLNPTTGQCRPWSYDAEAKQVTLEGVGAYLGLAKVYNGGELGRPTRLLRRSPTT